MGLAMGFFLSMFDSSTMHTANYTNMTNTQIFKLTMKQTWTKSVALSKQFAFIGGVYSGVECVIEKARAKHDVNNAVYAGCVTGAGLAIKGGPGSAAVGCAGFAVFSYAIEKYFIE